MQFNECLYTRRKALGMNQEELAERVGVSRQAVSKWETGEAQPDIAKLSAIADALDISADELCGRALPEKEESTGATEPAAPSRRGIVSRIVCVILALLLVVAAFFFGRYTQENAAPLPDILTVSGVDFTSTADGVAYRFVPGISGEKYSYSISFTNEYGLVQTFDCVPENGVCTGVSVISSYHPYVVSVTVSNGKDNRSVAVAQNIIFTKNSWSGNILTD